MIQTRLFDQKVRYNTDPINSVNKDTQVIRITDGCPHNCPFCYCPTEKRKFPIPKIVRNKVKILDMNLLSFDDALEIINELGSKKVKYGVVYYELVAGIDYRFLTQEIADALHKNRFGYFIRGGAWRRRIRMAWDWDYRDQIKIKNAIDILNKAGYRSFEIMVFMIANWKIKFEECISKLDMLKIWNVPVCDCYYDGQKPPNVIPIHWKDEEIKKFRVLCRRHNQIIHNRIDVEVL